MVDCCQQPKLSGQYLPGNSASRAQPKLSGQYLIGNNLIMPPMRNQNFMASICLVIMLPERSQGAPTEKKLTYLLGTRYIRFSNAPETPRWEFLPRQSEQLIYRSELHVPRFPNNLPRPTWSVVYLKCCAYVDHQPALYTLVNFTARTRGTTRRPYTASISVETLPV